jgi:hypothetical protein
LIFAFCGSALSSSCWSWREAKNYFTQRERSHERQQLRRRDRSYGGEIATTAEVFRYGGEIAAMAEVFNYREDFVAR